MNELSRRQRVASLEVQVPQVRQRRHESERSNFGGHQVEVLKRRRQVGQRGVEQVNANHVQSLQRQVPDDRERGRRQVPCVAEAKVLQLRQLGDFSQRGV